MKKIILTLVSTVLLFQLASYSQVKTGIMGGVSLARMEGRLHGNGRTGLMATLVVDANLGKNFSFYPTLSYVQKGVTEEHPAGTLIDKQYVAIRYAELSPNFTYNVNNANGSGFYLGLGPSIDFNLPSKRVSITDDVKVNNDLLFGSTPENDIRGIDWGVNILAGWHTSGGLVLGLNYNKGIRNLTPEGLPGGETKNSYIGIQIGAFINNKKN